MVILFFSPEQNLLPVTADACGTHPSLLPCFPASLLPFLLSFLQTPLDSLSTVVVPQSRKANETDKDKKGLEARADSIGSGRAIPIKQVGLPVCLPPPPLPSPPPPSCLSSKPALINSKKSHT